MDLDFLRDEQEWLAKQVIISDNILNFNPHDILFGVDIQYVDEQAFCAVSAYNFSGDSIQNFIFKTQTGMKYVSGFFCFREGPPILRTIRRILNKNNLIPKLMVIDGHGIAHPRRLGIASWIGVKTNISTIGIAKRPLLRYQGNLAVERGASLPILLKNKVVGTVLRTQKAVKPVFVSPGYKISIEQASKITLDISPNYRIATPIRISDQIARLYAKGNKMSNVTVL